ncbi:hypothetical protein [Streptomyces sioyaensis]|uniref:hypothetical protein n=1 Tax=Streptomyces sioyaensis TaxID=67364 RepID=UPI0037B57C45
MAFGPLIGTVFIGVIGIGGVMWIYAALHLLGSALVLGMKTPPGPQPEPGEHADPHRAERQPVGALTAPSRGL